MANPNYQLENFITTLNNWGLTDVLLPFILVFAIVFAILSRMNIFGDDKKNINIVVALVLGLIFIMPHVTGNYPPNYDPVDIINGAIPGVSIVAIAVIMVLLLIGLFGWKQEGSQVPWIIFLLAIVAVVYFFGSAAGWWYGWNSLSQFFGEDAVSLVVVLLVFGIIIWFITSTGKSGTTGKKVFGDLGKWLGGK